VAGTIDRLRQRGQPDAGARHRRAREIALRTPWAPAGAVIRQLLLESSLLA